MKILLLDGTAGFTPNCLKERATGGIATSLSILPRMWAAMGHEVSVYHHDFVKTQHIDGVGWLDGDDTRLCKPDVIIYNRDYIKQEFIDYFAGAIQVVWLHDIPDPRVTYDHCLHKADSIVALSEYHKRSFADYWDIPESKFTVIPNGVDHSVFYCDNLPRDRHLFIHASAPIKGGLDVLGYVFTEMRKFDPKFTLETYASQSLHKLNNGDYEAKLKSLAAAGITVCEPVPQAVLADRLRRAQGLLMPNFYPENCSNIMLQALACHTPVVSSNTGSAGEWINPGRNGQLTHTYPHDLFWFFQDFLNKVKSVATNGMWSFEEIASWQEISLNWDAHLRKLIRCAAPNAAASDGGKTLTTESPAPAEAVC